MTEHDAPRQVPAAAPPAERSAPPWAEPGLGSMIAIELGTTEAGPDRIVDVDVDAVAAIVGRIAVPFGDPSVSPMPALFRVAFWVGGNSQYNWAVSENAGATNFLHHLFAAVRDGDYPAEDRERDFARSQLDRSDRPVIHGPCLVTGLALDHETPEPLGEAFAAWYRDLRDEHVETFGRPDPDETGETRLLLRSRPRVPRGRPFPGVDAV
uniref:hypothetical protein n=1 Tax=Amycolatopsis sp. CA-096443 TaxID=3239919 RepID=UPI003F49574D